MNADLTVISGRYGCIVADPPWRYDEFCQIHSKAGKVVKPLPYNHMSLDEIAEMDVRGLAADNCRLWLWATNRYLPNAFGIMAAWGFTYKQTVVWHKKGNPSPWGGSVAPNHAEFLLVGVVGKPRRVKMLRSNVWQANVSKHSKKPSGFMNLIEECTDGPYLELFSREPRLGWTSWGDGV